MFKVCLHGVRRAKIKSKTKQKSIARMTHVEEETERERVIMCERQTERKRRNDTMCKRDRTTSSSVVSIRNRIQRLFRVMKIIRNQQKNAVEEKNKIRTFMVN